MSDTHTENGIPTENEELKRIFPEKMKEAEELRKRAEKYQYMFENSEKTIKEIEQKCQEEFGVSIDGLLPLIEKSVKQNDAMRSSYIEDVNTARDALDKLDREMANLERM